MPDAYLVYICRNVTDRLELEKYWSQVGSTLEGTGAENLAAYTHFDVLEKDSENVEGVVLTRFPSMQAAKDWYHGAAYNEVHKRRVKAAKYLGILVEGGWLPPEQRMPETTNTRSTYSGSEEGTAP
jgi:uncharacterized protein (DUF1330 family)